MGEPVLRCVLRIDLAGKARWCDKCFKTKDPKKVVCEWATKRVRNVQNVQFVKFPWGAPQDKITSHNQSLTRAERITEAMQRLSLDRGT
jgi:hypothetical protein